MTIEIVVPADAVMVQRQPLGAVQVRPHAWRHRRRRVPSNRRRQRVKAAPVTQRQSCTILPTFPDTPPPAAVQTTSHR
jgi:hypothetical protein